MDAAFPAERHRRPSISVPDTPTPTLSCEAMALDWLAAELPNLVAVTTYAGKHGWPGHAVRLSETVFRYLDSAACFPEAIIVHDHARRAACRTGDRTAEANALVSLGVIDGHQGRHQQATDHLEQALSRYRETGDRDGQARALNYLGLVHRQQGRYQRAAGQLRQALASYRERNDPSGQSVTVNSLGDLFLATGRLIDARTQYAHALHLAAQIGAKYEQARAHDGLAAAHQASGVPAKARHHWQQALALYIDLGAPETQRIRAHLTGDGHLPTSRPPGWLWA